MNEETPLRSEEDIQILLHREIHFGGKFSIMLDYYRNGGKGVQQEIEISQIEAVAIAEKDFGRDLAPELLLGADAETVGRSKEIYQSLRDLCEGRERFPRLIASLILSEEEAEEEIDAVVSEGSAIVPSLIELLRSVEMQDPLFPGYGTSPSLAATCLGKIGDKRAIYALFEGLGEGNFFDEEPLLNALSSIGEPAKVFLLKLLESRPITEDNITAAIALGTFREDPKIAVAAASLLKEPEAINNFPFATYLVLCCEALPPKEKEALKKLAEDKRYPPALRRDLLAI